MLQTEARAPTAKTGLVVREIEMFALATRLVHQSVLPEIRSEDETIGREVSFSHLIAVEEDLNAMIGSLDLDDPAIGGDSRAPFRAFAASKEGLRKQAEVGNPVATRRVVQTIHPRPQPRAH